MTTPLHPLSETLLDDLRAAYDQGHMQPWHERLAAIEAAARAEAEDACGSRQGAPHRGRRFPWHAIGCMRVHDEGTPCGPGGAGWSSDD